MAQLRQHMINIKTSIEAVWKPSSTIEFKNQIVTVFDLAIISPTVSNVSFFGCHSKEWVQIGQRLGALPQLKILSTEHCNSEDNLSVGICGSKSLESLRMGK
jgi:hypothetical protein